MEENNNYDEDVKRLIEEALINNIETRRKYKKKNELKDTVRGIISEYLDSFILIGYDFNGKPIEVIGSTTDQQTDALDTLLMKYFAYKAMGND
jgi:hypothetical protein